MVTDLSRFPRPSAGVTSAAGNKLLPSREAEQAKLKSQARSDLPVNFQQRVNPLQVRKQGVVQPLAQARRRPAAAA